MLSQKALGTSGWEVFHLFEKSVELQYSDQQLKTKEISESDGYGIRVLKNKKIGFSYCEDQEKLKVSAARAAQISRFSPKSEFSFPKKQKIKQLDIYDKRTAEIEIEEIKAHLEQIMDALGNAKKKSRIMVSMDMNKISLDNSNGFSDSYQATQMNAYCEVMLGKGSGFSYKSSVGILDKPWEIGKDALRMAKDMAHPKKPAPGKYEVVFSQEAIDNILEIFIPSLSGEWKRKAISKLADKKGKQIVSPLLSIYDDPLATGESSMPFDDEGIPSERRALVENGELKGFIWNREIAALAKTNEEGFCSRESYSSNPSISCSNKVIPPGDYTDFEQELRNFILIYSAHGTHTANLTTGDFGLEVNIAFHIKDGKRIPIRGFMISGNIFELLNKITGLEKTQKTHGDLIAPRIAFGEVNVVS